MCHAGADKVDPNLGPGRQEVRWITCHSQLQHTRNSRTRRAIRETQQQRQVNWTDDSTKTGLQYTPYEGIRCRWREAEENRWGLMNGKTLGVEEGRKHHKSPLNANRKTQNETEMTRTQRHAAILSLTSDYTRSHFTPICDCAGQLPGVNVKFCGSPGNSCKKKLSEYIKGFEFQSAKWMWC